VSFQETLQGKRPIERDLCVDVRMCGQKLSHKELTADSQGHCKQVTQRLGIQPRFDLGSHLPPVIVQFMSVFSNAQNSHIHLQDSPLTAVAGDQQNSGPVTGPQHIAGNQIIYNGAPLKGDRLSSFAIFF